MRTTERRKTLKFFFKNRDDHRIDAIIERVEDAMEREDPTGDKYPKLVTYLERLHDIKAKVSRVRVSPDTWALIGGNLLGILFIVMYEQKHVMTSKAQSMLIRPERQR
jgi:hypothetical protein